MEIAGIVALGWIKEIPFKLLLSKSKQLNQENNKVNEENKYSNELIFLPYKMLTAAMVITKRTTAVKLAKNTHYYDYINLKARALQRSSIHLL